MGVNVPEKVLSNTRMAPFLCLLDLVILLVCFLVIPNTYYDESNNSIGFTI